MGLCDYSGLYEDSVYFTYVLRLNRSHSSSTGVMSFCSFSVVLKDEICFLGWNGKRNYSLEMKIEC